MTENAYIELRNISKAFGQVQANQDVSLSVNRGEILALLGENGSGKSTLVNMLSGIYMPDSGSIFIDGKEQFFSSPYDAIRAGIGMVHQHFKLVSVMTARENIAIGERKKFFINNSAITEKIYQVEKHFGLVINPDKKIYNMSVGEKQTVEILKVLYRGARVLILDEPTAVLTPQEITQLFSILRKMKEDGCSIIIITHKLNEVMEISDRVTVLRKGRSAGTVRTAETAPRELTELMVGAPISLEIKRAETEKTAAPMLEVRNLTETDENNVRLLNDISFDLYGGEILGVAGIAGSGQKELCETIAGLIRADSGSIRFLGEEITGLSPRTIIRKGITMSFIPEDRLGMGLVAGRDITDNILLKSYNWNSGLFINRNEGRRKAEEIVRDYDISTPSVNHIVKKLSGGNIQKVLLGREIEMQPKLLITAYPVRGLDIGASYTIYDMLNEQKKRGVAILYIGEDLDVLRSLCDRIIVIHNGAVMGIVDPEKTSKEDIGLLMLGEKQGDENSREEVK
ncbi:ABC transporter ATP-binding protein [Brucepastera parasyntrophica]|uniref:ABC transporter ATP-binding protein n=1 Tax=Brucepastera parasyntrophica TaxID=2880008 RepID=UPI00210BFCA6|nr:ABC transporter ATP-binding protein [Brucepastera parasyntrophica]ULQ60920.1 ABC transporter ATP-binding protein [Brucepastera parasyntrophica]